jgi:hypothetical protein
MYPGRKAKKKRMQRYRDWKIFSSMETARREQLTGRSETILGARNLLDRVPGLTRKLSRVEMQKMVCLGGVRSNRTATKATEVDESLYLYQEQKG